MVGIGIGIGIQYVTEPIAEVVPDVGWLKCTYKEDQTDALSGITNSLSTSYTESVGDYFIPTMRIYLQNTIGDDWDGTDPVKTYSQYFGYGVNVDVVQETLTNYASSPSGTAPSAPYSNAFRIYFPISSDDLPKAGAVLWIKDIVLKVYNASDVLLFTYTSDFTSSLDGWGDYSIEGVLTKEYNQELLS